MFCEFMKTNNTLTQCDISFSKTENKTFESITFNFFFVIEGMIFSLFAQCCNCPDRKKMFKTNLIVKSVKQ